MATRKTTASSDEVDVKPQEVPEVTRLDTDVHAPATNAPGDAPADTTDPTERASTIVPQAPSPEALAAGTILGAVPVPEGVVPTVVHGVTNADGEEERVEEYETTDPHGAVIRVRHFIDRGETIRI